MLRAAVVLALRFAVLKGVIDEIAESLTDKLVVVPSNLLGIDAEGNVSPLLPKGQSSGEVVAGWLPTGARLAMAFGTLSADLSESSSNRAPEPAVLFYATDDDRAGEEVERLVRTAGFEPVKVGGIEQSGRLEVGGDLHDLVVGPAEARSMIGGAWSLRCPGRHLFGRAFAQMVLTALTFAVSKGTDRGIETRWLPPRHTFPCPLTCPFPANPVQEGPQRCPGAVRCQPGRWRPFHAPLLRTSQGQGAQPGRQHRRRCRTGICHTCNTPLLSGAVSYSPDPLEAPSDGQVLICCSQPRFRHRPGHVTGNGTPPRDTQPPRPCHGQRQFGRHQTAQ